MPNEKVRPEEKKKIFDELWFCSSRISDNIREIIELQKNKRKSKRRDADIKYIIDYNIYLNKKIRSLSKRISEID